MVQMRSCVQNNQNLLAGAHRPYLEQRHATAVAYLNDPGEEFDGGVLNFRDGHLRSVSPERGSLVRYRQHTACILRNDNWMLDQGITKP